MDSNTMQTFYPTVALAQAPRPTGVSIYDAANASYMPESNFNVLEPTNYQEIVSFYPSKGMSMSSHSNFNGIDEESRIPTLHTDYTHSSFSAPYIVNSTTGIDIECEKCGTKQRKYYESNYGELEVSPVLFSPVIVVGALLLLIYFALKK